MSDKKNDLKLEEYNNNNNTNNYKKEKSGKKDRILGYCIFITQKIWYTNNEIKKKLQDKFGLNYNDDKEKVNYYIEQLTKRGLLDNHMFIKLNTEGYLHRGYGEKYIRKFFKRRLIDDIDIIINKNTEYEYFIDYLKDKLQRGIINKILSKEEERKLKNKLIGRGYSYNTINKAFNELGIKIDYSKITEKETKKIIKKIERLQKKGKDNFYIQNNIYQQYGIKIKISADNTISFG